MSKYLKELIGLEIPKADDPRWIATIGEGTVRHDPADWSARVWRTVEPTPCHIIPNYWKGWAAVKIEDTIGFAILN